MFALLDGPNTFQLIPESRDCRIRGAPMFHGEFGRLEPQLRRLNRLGCGVFVAVNQTDLKGRKATNVVAVREFYADIDGLPSREPKCAVFHDLLGLSLPPSAVVETRNGLQAYFHASWGTPLEVYERVQRGVVKALRGDPQVRDIARVLRVPGFYHLKREPFKVRLIYESGVVYTADELLTAYPAPPAPQVRYTRPLNEPEVWTKVLEGAAAWAAPPQNRHLAMYLLGGVAHKFGVSPEDAFASLEPIVAGWNIERNWQPELRRTVRDGHTRGPATVKALRGLGMPIPGLGRP